MRYESLQSTRAGRCERSQSTGTPVEKVPIGRAAAVAARRAAVVSAHRHLERSRFTASSRSAVPVEHCLHVHRHETALIAPC